MSIVSDSLVQLERIYISSVMRISPQLQPVPVMIGSADKNTSSARTEKSFDIKEIFDGFLWGVPTCRRSAEKRMMRKYGAPNWHNKLILPKRDLKVCFSCGQYHENNRLCRKKAARVVSDVDNSLHSLPCSQLLQQSQGGNECHAGEGCGRARSESYRSRSCRSVRRWEGTAEWRIFQGNPTSFGIPLVVFGIMTNFHWNF